MIFTIPGEPEGKARPRVVRNQGKVHAFTPSKTKAYEERVRTAYIAADGKHFAKHPIAISIFAYFKIPKSTTEAVRQAMLNGDVYPLKKPDVDNIAKVICDSLNGYAYTDDSQIVTLTIRKQYSEDPHVTVLIDSI